MVHEVLPTTADSSVEIDPPWDMAEGAQHAADKEMVEHYYEKKRQPAARHRFNSKEKMWQAWERMEMLKNDFDTCRRCPQSGRKIQVKKMPKKKPNVHPHLWQLRARASRRVEQQMAR